MKTESIMRTLEGLFVNVNLCTEEDLNRVDTLVISRTDFDGTILNVDYNDLLNFKKLFNLTIDRCMIDNELINILSNLSNLKRLTLINCDVIEDIKDSFSKLNLKDLVLLNIDFDLSYLIKDYDEIRLVAVPFKYFSSHCKKLDVSQCIIDDVDSLLKINCDELIISYDLYSKNQSKFNNADRKVTVMEDNGVFVSKKVGLDG